MNCSILQLNVKKRRGTENWHIGCLYWSVILKKRATVRKWDYITLTLPMRLPFRAVSGKTSWQLTTTLLKKNLPFERDSDYTPARFEMKHSFQAFSSIAWESCLINPLIFLEHIDKRSVTCHWQLSGCSASRVNIEQLPNRCLALKRRGYLLW